MKPKHTLYLITLAFAGLILFLAADKLMVENPAVKLAEHDQLIMYSITGCDACREKRREFDRAGIKYVEYVVDRHPTGGEEFMGKLSQAGFAVNQVGYPSFDVKGTLIPNNPPLFQIKKYMAEES